MPLTTPVLYSHNITETSTIESVASTSSPPQQTPSSHPDKVCFLFSQLFDVVSGTCYTCWVQLSLVKQTKTQKVWA